MTDSETFTHDQVGVLLASTEAGRRVGWAKYFAEAERGDRAEMLAAHRMGMIAEYARRARALALPSEVVVRAIAGFIEQTMVEPHTRAAFDQGVKDLPRHIEERYGRMHRAIRVHAQTDDLPQHQFRCPECRRLQGVLDSSTEEFVTRCTRCKVDLHLPLWEKS